MNSRKRHPLLQYQHTTHHTVTVPSHYLHAHAGEGKPLLLMLHGFADTAHSFLRRSLPDSPDLPERFEILAPDGPFPVPQWVDGDWKNAYAWYFANLSENRIVVAPAVAAKAVAELVHRLGLTEREKVLCGFSQGGYFLPHLARELKNVRSLIAIGSGFHPRFFAEFNLQLPVHAIHGAADEVISLGEAQTDFIGLEDWNKGGRMKVIPGMTHAFNEQGREALASLLGEKAGLGI